MPFSNDVAGWTDLTDVRLLYRCRPNATSCKNECMAISDDGTESQLMGKYLSAE